WRAAPTIATSQNLRAVWGAQGTVFIGGWAATIAAQTTAGWVLQTSSPTLLSVWGPPGGAGPYYAVGAGGAVLRRDGAAWTTLQVPPVNDLYAVTGSGSSNVYVVGDTGTILQFDGSHWSQLSSPTTVRLRAVWGSDPRDVFAAGEAGTILRWDGVRWYRMTSSTTKELRALWGTGPTDVYASGEDGI